MKRFSLSSYERVKKEKDFKKIFSLGKIIYSASNKLKVNYFTEIGTGKYCTKIAAAVNRKAGCAVWRNRVKRLIRNSYRLNKTDILEICKDKNICIYMVFSPVTLNEIKNKKISLKEILPDMIEMMNKIKDTL